MSRTSTILYVLIGLLTVDALLELAFISSTVSFLHRRAGDSFQVIYGPNYASFRLHGKPEHLLLNEGHTSNGAAGTAIVLVGIGGLLTFWLLARDARAGHRTKFAVIAHHAWMVVSLLSLLLTIAALGYTMAAVNAHQGQTIDITVARSLNNQPYPRYVAYPLDSWTPENWFAAVLALPLTLKQDRDLIRTKYNVIKGWRWNLIPMFLLGLAVVIVGIIDALERRKAMRQSKAVNTKEYDIASEEGQKVESPMLPQGEHQHSATQPSAVAS